jgi:hypothetical protein
MALLRKAEPAQSLNFHPIVLIGKLTCEGSIMQEQLEIIDLGDAMLETRCTQTVGPQFDFAFGAGHWRC